MNIKLYNVTLSAVAVEKRCRMGQPIAEAEGCVWPRPVEFHAERFVIGVYAEDERHDEKVAALKALYQDELNVGSADIEIKHVGVPYAFPKAIVRDIWILRPSGHLGVGDQTTVGEPRSGGCSV